MKSVLRKAVSSAVENDGVYRLLDATILKFARYAEWSHRVHVQDAAAHAAIERLSPRLTVLHGPFAGMRYPRAFATGSCLFPKILGSYEQELRPLIEQICDTPYATILDIGCAEGYYAVGLARRIPSAVVRAYDTDVAAVRSCEEMARANDVADRLITGEFCEPATILGLSMTGRALVIADCEGYERDLFTDEVVRHLALHDVLIEVHDVVDIEISGVLRRRFSETHELTVVQSIDDLEKVFTYDYEELAGYTLAQRRVLLGEERATIMQWFFFAPKRCATA